MKQEQYQDAADGRKKDAESIRLENGTLFEEIRKFIEQHKTCALAAGHGDFIQCTPIDYSFREGRFWMFSEDEQKFNGLKHNKNVSIAIYDEYKGFGQLNGMQINGMAEVVMPFSDEYNFHARKKGIEIEVLKKLPFVMHLIKVKPTHIDYLCSGFHYMQQIFA
ncbi:MAG: pyridoxamine 5'-phosphate oxidase family protein [Eubacteriales bacterium]|nr:pyridoxamine 5'-phosphate oxidase family protein [Eubacteriales bacterium]